jgi:hypothetical protein
VWTDWTVDWTGALVHDQANIIGTRCHRGKEVRSRVLDVLDEECNVFEDLCGPRSQTFGDLDGTSDGPLQYGKVVGASRRYKGQRVVDDTLAKNCVYVHEKLFKGLEGLVVVIVETVISIVENKVDELGAARWAQEWFARVKPDVDHGGCRHGIGCTFVSQRR